MSTSIRVSKESFWTIPIHSRLFELYQCILSSTFGEYSLRVYGINNITLLLLFSFPLPAICGDSISHLFSQTRPRSTNATFAQAPRTNNNLWTSSNILNSIATLQITIAPDQPIALPQRNLQLLPKATK